MNLLFWKRKASFECEFQDSCNCGDLRKKPTCEECKYYYMVDSGYGYCRALPEHICVAWCRDVCSLFLFPKKVKDTTIELDNNDHIFVIAEKVGARLKNLSNRRRHI